MFTIPTWEQDTYLHTNYTSMNRCSFCNLCNKYLKYNLGMGPPAVHLKSSAENMPCKRTKPASVMHKISPCESNLHVNKPQATPIHARALRVALSVRRNIEYRIQNLYCPWLTQKSAVQLHRSRATATGMSRQETHAGVKKCIFLILSGETCTT